MTFWSMGTYSTAVLHLLLIPEVVFVMFFLCGVCLCRVSMDTSVRTPQGSLTNLGTDFTIMS